MKLAKRAVALLLALTMLFGIVGCAGNAGSTNTSLQTNTQRNPSPTVPNPTEPAQNTAQNPQTNTEENSDPWQPQEYESSYTPLNLPAEEPQREDLEEILDLVSKDSISSEEVSDLDEDALEDLIEDLLEQPQTENPTLQGDPTVPVDTKKDSIADDGSLKAPFDQVYPELMDDVVFSGESLLVKLESYVQGELSEGLRQSGVGKLDLLFSMDDADWYEAHLVEGTEPGEAIAALRQCDEVLLADYNYSGRADAMDLPQTIPGAIANNAKVADQWYLRNCGIPAGMAQLSVPGGSPNVIVAVIDTGVDYNHVDLADNIWVNDKEIPDDDIDNDGNGYYDDYYGVNVIAGHGNGDDDNGHGTHVAGIIAAQNNNLGTVGIAYNVKIMPIKALNSEGVTNDSDIVKAIFYAVENGAEIINMSFGQEAMSVSVQDALKIASQQCVLVASAGNDGAANEGDNAIPNYPAALNYVLGVMSVDKNGKESAFSSYDSKAFNGIEYELYAPGEAILSTIPGDRYASWSGTSMAAPMVSAMAALLRSHYADRSKYTPEFIYGQLTATSEYFADCCNPGKHGDHTKAPIVNLYAALTKLPEPDVVLSSFDLFDTMGFVQDMDELNNGDGVLDAGETVALGLTLRNRWGAAENTLVSLEVDSEYVTLHNPSVNFERIGTYSTKDSGKIYTEDLLTGWENPFYITVDEDCPGSTVLNLQVTVSCDNSLNPADTKDHTWTGTIQLQVRSGSVLPTVIEEDMTLKSGNLYIIENATTIEEGVTVTAEPGSMIQFWSADPNNPHANSYMPALTVRGQFLVQGTKENPVQIFPIEKLVYTDENGYSTSRTGLAVRMSVENKGVISLIHADVTNMLGSATYADSCTFRTNADSYSLQYRYLSGGRVDWSSSYSNIRMGTAENCVYYQLRNANIDGTQQRCAFVHCEISFHSSCIYRDCLFLGNSYVRHYPNAEAGKDPSMTYYTSDYRAQTTDFSLQSNQVNTYYRPETGTTYFRLYIPNASADPQAMALYVQSLGGGYAAIEDQQELNWIRSNIPMRYGTSSNGDEYRYRYELGIQYDFHTQQYVWADGTPLGDFLEVEGLTDIYTKQPVHLLGGSLTTQTSYYSRYYLYEVPGPIYVTDIRLGQYNVLLDMDTTYQIVPSTTPGNVEPEDLVFTSENEDVVTVDESGLVTPVGLGVANVTVSSDDGYVSTYATFYVRELTALEDLAFETEETVLAVGESGTTSLSYFPADTTRKAVTYTSSDESIVTVDRLGRLTSKAPGDAVITATSQELDAAGEPITAELNVHTYREATGLTLESDTLLTAWGLEETIFFPDYTVIPADSEVEMTWRTTDPKVVDVDEYGTMTVEGTGTATIVMTDLRSGLSVSCLVIVAGDGEILTLQDMRGGSGNYYALTDDGTLYYWDNGDTYRTPKVIAREVAKYHAVSTEAFVQKEDGSLSFVRPSYSESLPRFNGTVQDLKHSYYNDFYILDDKGSIYFKTARDSSPWELLNTMEDSVVQMAVGSNYAWLLTEYGDLYCVPVGETTLSEPLLTDVTMLGSYSESFDGSGITVLTEDGYRVRVTQSGSASYSSQPIPEVDQLFLYANLQDCWAIKDGIAFEIPFYTSETPTVTQFPKIDNAVHVAWSNTGYGNVYVITEDGLLYGIGKNVNNAFAGSTTDYDITDPVLIPMSPVEDDLRITGNNLAEGTVLFEDTLELEFSNTLKAATARLYATYGDVTEELRFTSTIHDENFVTVSLKDGFQKGVTYRLVFPAGKITAPYNVTNSEEISISFRYGLEQTRNSFNVRTDASNVFMNLLNIRDWSGLKLSWYSTDESVAYMNEENRLEPVGAGITTIAFREAVSGLEGTFEVTVWEPSYDEETYNPEIHRVPGSIAVESINLEETDDGPAILSQDKLVVDFNTPMEQVNYTFYILRDETPEAMEVESVIDLDKLIISIPGHELIIGWEYILEISGEGTTAVYGQLNPDLEEKYYFTYIPVEEEEIIDTTVTRDALIDETVERFYWSSQNFTETILENYETLKLNYRFLGNVILNRFSTDTNPDHWLRIQAPESSGQSIPFGSNYWGTANETAIGLQILDYYDFTTYGKIAYAPYLETAPENTFPFVTDLTILDKSGTPTTHLSNEEITVRITFSRDMDTEVLPTVTFGNHYPYDQNIVEGKFLDARTWEGSYILTAIVKDGNHCFRVSGGRSAEDGLELFADWGRYSFELDTASAQAMLMQAEATSEGIKLSWSQDDFDTLMGYNVYRSTADEYAYTQRINTSVIPAGTEEFFDADVEPGVVYYYSFSVVQTDLSESAPSNKIQIMSMDTMAPDLYHTPVYSTSLGANMMVTATVKDNVGIQNVYVYYRTIGQTQWNTAVMNCLNDKYSVLISGDQITAEGLEYYIEATDGVSSTFWRSASNPFQVEITAATDPNAKGDVNGDGKISALDALMLLKAINNLSYLNIEQFTRADLNSNGILEAMEALRILQYVSGKLGSVNMA